MNIFHAFILGALQGLTEFLPVSSSGHLVLAQNLIPGFRQPGILFDTVVHAGTLTAIAIFYWRKIIRIERQYIINIVVGSVPAVILGLLIQGKIELLFGSVKLVGFALLVTAFLNFLTDKKIKSVKEEGSKKISANQALIIGVAQAFAIIPGISRSGATIFAGVKTDINRKLAAEFSFLLSIPAILGANTLQLASHWGGGDLAFPVYAAGFFSSVVFGLLAINAVLKLLEGVKFKYFAVYCAIVGLLTLVV
jgi:undecaprenyl-diphosphatase